MRRALAVLLCCLTLPAFAALAVGDRLPDVTAKNVAGELKSLHTLLGQDGPTLIVVMTDHNAADLMRGWFTEATKRELGANRVSIISIDLPWYVPEGMARSEAEERVPKRWWEETLYDTDRTMAKELALEGDPDRPWAFAVDSEGRVLARFHGPPDAPGADRVFEALDGH